jgi:HAD superfamily hydrolase (TIGR01662 family)
MLATSAVIPAAATWHTLLGLWRHRAARPWHGPPELVLFDRDGTLVHDVPYNSNPAWVEPVPGALEAVGRVRDAGIRTGVVTNQSGVASGRISHDQLAAVNDRVEDLLGPFDVWQVCPHGRHDGCDCRKPAPGMVKAACERLGVPADRCALVGDIGADVEAAEAAGATGVLVPTPQTRPQEIAAATHVHADIAGAVSWLLDGAA